MPSQFTRIFGGKKYQAVSGHRTKRDAQKKASQLRKQGASVRVVPASKHDRERHNVFYDVYAR